MLTNYYYYYIMLNLKFNEDTSFTYASSSLNFAFMDCIFELKILYTNRISLDIYG